MTEGPGGALARLSQAINRARQLTQHTRGHELEPERADELAELLRAAQRLVQGKPPLAPKQRLRSKELPRPQTGTARYQLWQRSPLCLWCGRETQIERIHDDAAATLDHLHRKGQRQGRALPLFVLACRKCNSERGEPPPAPEGCPVLAGR